eukprot:scaffold78759_cov35-Tisochrysis_lutea.AAC.2
MRGAGPRRAEVVAAARAPAAPPGSDSPALSSPSSGSPPLPNLALSLPFSLPPSKCFHFFSYSMYCYVCPYGAYVFAVPVSLSLSPSFLATP